jgi:hypothetical protein
MNTTTNNINVTIDDNDFFNAIETMIENTLRETRAINDDVVVDFRDMMIDVSTHDARTTRDDDNDVDVFTSMKLSCM